MVASTAVAAHRSQPVLVYDGACGFCTGMAQFVQQRLREPADVVPWQSIDLGDVGLSETEADATAWWIEPNGNRLSGHRAVARALRACGPPWRQLGRFIDLPVVRHAGAPVYRFVSRNRDKLPGVVPVVQDRDGDSGAFPPKLQASSDRARIGRRSR